MEKKEGNRENKNLQEDGRQQKRKKERKKTDRERRRIVINGTGQSLGGCGVWDKSGCAGLYHLKAPRRTF